MWTTERAGHKTSKTNTQNGRKRHTDLRAKWQEEWDSNNNNTSIEWFHFDVNKSTTLQKKLYHVWMLSLNLIFSSFKKNNFSELEFYKKKKINKNKI